MMYMCVQINTYANILFIMQNKRIIKIKWQRCTDSPVTNAIPQTVKIDDNVYVGHGLRKRNEDQTVFKYSLTQDTWSRLPPCPTNHYGFASLDEELILVGGNFRGSRHQPTNAVYIFRDNTWRQGPPAYAYTQKPSVYCIVRQQVDHCCWRCNKDRI